MFTSRRSILAGLGLAPLEIAASATQAPGPSEDKSPFAQVAEIVQRSAEGNAALMRGDAQTYMARVPLGDDFLLMSPFGGPPSQGARYTPERIEAIARFFKNGSFEQELIRSWSSPDTVVLATIERMHAEVGGLPAQDWALRVTLVYRREGSEWRLVHRHADPLARGVTVAQAAAIARGDLEGRL
jgi:ketosteroid isomerase-like protein